MLNSKKNMIKPNIQPKEPTKSVASPIRNMSAKIGVTRCIMSKLYPTSNLSQ